MVLNITFNQLREMTDCIVDNGLDNEEAFRYAKSMLMDCNNDNIVDSEDIVKDLQLLITNQN